MISKKYSKPTLVSFTTAKPQPWTRAPSYDRYYMHGETQMTSTKLYPYVTVGRIHCISALRLPIALSTCMPI